MSKGGVVVAGAAGTAAVGAEILRQGGHAVDAAVAACMATSAYEPVLTSLAGGGIMLVHDVDSDQDVVVDFFSSAPGLGLNLEQRRGRDFYPVTVDFGEAQQAFHIGRGSVAVPATLAGLGAAHQRFGRLPLTELVQPVSAALRQGVVMDAFQAQTFVLLEPILRASPEASALYTDHGRLLDQGDRFSNPALADSLDLMAKLGAQAFCQQEIAPRLCQAFGSEQGGLITARDLTEYQVEFLSPLRRRYRDFDLLAPPWPTQGGVLMATLLAMLETLPAGSLQRGTEAYLRAMLASQQVVDEVRRSAQDPFSAATLKRWQGRFQELFAGADPHLPPAQVGPGNTTHVSVIDGQGNSATVTISYGEGCGHILDDTGLELNNFMGEYDLMPQGFENFTPGRRLQTNMCPTRMSQNGRQWVLGSGGANRIRTAMAQVLSNLVDQGMDISAAVAAGRMHSEGGECNLETFDLDLSPAILRSLIGDAKLNAFSAANMFFGGVHMAQREPDGQLSGAGDPRRSGAVAFA